jgi:hypothetical protein
MPFDIKQFFRFVVSGYVCLLYYFAILFAFSNALHRLRETMALTFPDLFTIVLSSLVLSVPLGFLIHELDISIYSPYRLSRFGCERDSMKMISAVVRKATNNVVRSECLQALLEFAKFSGEDSKDVNAHLDKELSNRYSYYYARMEAAVYAPVFAVVLFAATVLLGRLDVRVTFLGVMVITGIGAISATLLLYARRLLREIDAIETLIVMDRKEDLSRLARYLRDAGATVPDDKGAD